MAKKYRKSDVINLPRSQWRYVQAAPPAWLVLLLLAGIILVSLWWGIASQLEKFPVSSTPCSPSWVMVVSGGRDG